MLPEFLTAVIHFVGCFIGSAIVVKVALKG